MKYLDGREVHIGDIVKCWEGCFGVVVCSIDANEYSDEYPEGWVFLKEGVLILSDEAGLIHYTEANEDLELIERAEKK